MKTPTTQRAGWRKLQAVQGLAEKHSQSNETGMENISTSIVLWSSVCMPYISLCSWSCACVCTVLLLLWKYGGSPSIQQHFPVNLQFLTDRLKQILFVWWWDFVQSWQNLEFWRLWMVALSIRLKQILFVWWWDCPVMTKLRAWRLWMVALSIFAWWLSSGALLSD